MRALQDHDQDTNREAGRPNRPSYTRTTVRVQERKVYATCSTVFTTRYRRGSKTAMKEATFNIYRNSNYILFKVLWSAVENDETGKIIRHF